MNQNLRFMRDFIRELPEYYSYRFIKALNLSQFDQEILINLDVLKLTQKVVAYNMGNVCEKTVVRWHIKALQMSYEAFKRFIFRALEVSED